MKKMIISTIYFMMLFSACDQGVDQKVEEPIDIDTTEVYIEDFEILWTTDYLSKGARADISLQYKDILICDYANADPAHIFAIDKESGETLWEWSPTGENQRSVTTMQLSGDFLVCHTNKGFYAIDLRDQSEIWNYLAPRNSGPDFDLCGTEVFWNEMHGNIPFADSVTVHSYNLLTELYQKHITLDKKDLYGITPVWGGANIGFDKATGDSILYYSIVALRKAGDTILPKYIHGYNLEQNEHVFPATELIGGETPVLIQIKVEGDFLYHSSDNSMYKIHRNTGEIVWDTEFPWAETVAGANLTDVLVTEDAIYVNPGYPLLYKLDKETGRIIWETKDASTCNNEMLIAKDMLMMSCWGEGRVMGFDLDTGERLVEIKEAIPNSNFWRSQLHYDEERDLFYCLDLRGMVCMRLRE